MAAGALRLGLENTYFETAPGSFAFLNLDPSIERDWIDLSGRVRAIDVDRGRMDLKTAFETGKIKVVIDNNDRDLDTDNPDSPYWDAGAGKSTLKRDTLIRVYQKFDTGPDATKYGLFFGFSGAWRSVFDEAEAGLDCTIPLVGWDALKHLRRTPFTGSLPEETTGRRIRRLLAFAGFSAGSMVAVGSLGVRTLAAVYVPNQPIIDLIDSAVRTEGPQARFFINRDGFPYFVDAHAVWLDPLLSSVKATFDNTGAFGLPYQKLPTAETDEDMFNQVRVTIVTAEDREPTVTVVAADIVPAASTLFVIAPGLRSPLPKGAVLDFGAANCVRLTAAAPASSAPLQQLEVEPLYTDVSQGAQAVYDPNAAIAYDNESQARHGKRILPLSNLLLRTMTEAQGMAEDWLDSTIDPPSRYEAIGLSGIYSDELSEKIRDLGFADKIEIYHTPQAGGEPIYKVATIEGIGRKIRPGDDDAFLGLAPAAEDRAFWIWNDADPPIWGETTVLWV